MIWKFLQVNVDMQIKVIEYCFFFPQTRSHSPLLYHKKNGMGVLIGDQKLASMTRDLIDDIPARQRNLNFKQTVYIILFQLPQRVASFIKLITT